MLKENVSESVFDAPAKQFLWRNILFDKNGKRYTGNLHFDTQSKAADRLKQWEKSEGDYTDLQEGELLTSEYAWGMQMPYLE